MSNLWQNSYDILAKYGYAGLYFGLLAEGTGLPLPVQILFMIAAYFIKMSEMSLWRVILISAAGNLSGNILAYCIGYIGGPPVVNRLNRYLHMKDEDIKKVGEWFNRYGGVTNMISRWIGITRTPAIWTAGLLRINFLSYFIFSLIGDFFWAVFWMILYFKTYSEARKFLYLPWEYKIGIAIIFAAFIILAWKIFFKFFRKKVKWNRALYKGTMWDIIGHRISSP